MVMHVGRRLGDRPLEAHVLAQVQLEGADQADLDRGDADLAVALRTVAVADREQRVVDMDWQIERRARDQFLVVHVAAVPPRRRRLIEPQAAGGATAMTPKNGRSGIRGPTASADHPLRSSGMWISRFCLKSSGSAPGSGRIML